MNSLRLYWPETKLATWPGSFVSNDFGQIPPFGHMLLLFLLAMVAALLVAHLRA